MIIVSMTGASCISQPTGANPRGAPILVPVQQAMHWDKHQLGDIFLPDPCSDYISLRVPSAAEANGRDDLLGTVSRAGREAEERTYRDSTVVPSYHLMVPLPNMCAPSLPKGMDTWRMSDRILGTLPELPDHAPSSRTDGESTYYRIASRTHRCIYHPGTVSLAYARCGTLQRLSYQRGPLLL